MKTISGFSKLSKLEKIDYLVNEFFTGSNSKKELIKSFWHHDSKSQKVFDEFSENTLTNFYFPYGVVPNLLVNDKVYCAPMVIEESSVVAAASKAAKYWLSRGGFKAEVIGNEKVGQVHLLWHGKSKKLFKFFEQVKPMLLEEIEPLVKNMNERGGGLRELKLVDKTKEEKGYYQIYSTYDTKDAMGANFINSVLESLGHTFKRLVSENGFFNEKERELTIIMAILSNYTPDCLVRVKVECPIENLADKSLGMSASEFASKFEMAVKIAKLDVNRATTHNKGIFNGIDAVILATGNDFRAIEACGHTYASRSGQYRSLSDVEIKNGMFKFWLDIPLALGTVGGLTSLHPLARFSLDMLGRPTAEELMMVVAAVGLAQNFAAVRSLVTSGIQKGHMKMHLMNILNHLEASDEEREKTKKYFEERVVSFTSVREYLKTIRKYQ